MPKRVVAIEHEGLSIRVENTWFSGAKLFINDLLEDTNKQLISVSGAKPILTSTKELNGKKYDIAVYCVAWLSVKLKVCVNGVRVGGDIF